MSPIFDIKHFWWRTNELDYNSSKDTRNLILSMILIDVHPIIDINAFTIRDRLSTILWICRYLLLIWVSTCNTKSCWRQLYYEVSYPNTISLWSVVYSSMGSLPIRVLPLPSWNFLSTLHRPFLHANRWTCLLIRPPCCAPSAQRNITFDRFTF
jgi:hypothetical protein